jgi:hypothetical protein
MQHYMFRLLIVIFRYAKNIYNVKWNSLVNVQYKINLKLLQNALQN